MRTVSGILPLGGTIVSTSSYDPYRHEDGLQRVQAAVQADAFDAVVAIGGEHTMGITRRLYEDGLPMIGVPKTIDNDVCGTDLTFGFDTAVSTATDALDRLHSTAEAHERIMVVEVMGRNAGFIALAAGMAGGADVILLPEVPFHYEPVAEKVLLRERRGRCFSIVVAAEGAAPMGSDLVVKQAADAFRGAVVLGGIAERVAAELATRTGKEARSLVLGHLQRGGSPTTFDRLLGLRFGAAAVRALAEGQGSGMVAFRNQSVTLVSLEEAASGTKSVALDSDTMVTAREMGICFGDEPAGCFSGA